MLIGLIVPLAACPSECRCESRHRVYCNGRALRTIPHGIPSTTQTLHLQDNQLESGEDLNLALAKLNQLERLMLYSNRLSEVPKVNSQRLRELRLNSNRIQSIPPHVFANTPNLGELILDENLLSNSSFTPTSFAGAENIRRLSMIDNQLTLVPEDLPVSLEELYLSSNQINKVSANALTSLTSLRVLYLDHNQLVDTSFDADFTGILAEIVLSHNELESVPKLNAAIEELRLTSNNIRSVSRSQLEAAPRLKVLDLAFNSIQHIENGAMERLFDLERIELDGHDYVCDCHLTGLKRFLESRAVSQSRAQRYVETVLDKIICTGLEVSLGVLDEASMKCPVHEFSMQEDEKKLLVNVDNAMLPPFAATNVLYFVDGSIVEHLTVNKQHNQAAFNLDNSEEIDVCVQAENLPVDLLASKQSGRCRTFTRKQLKTVAVDVEAEPVLGLGQVNMQIVVGVFTGVFVIALLVTTLIVLMVRARRNGARFPDDFENESKMSYCSKLTSLSSGERTNRGTSHNGTAANQEFAFTLMLRDESGHLPRMVSSEPLQSSDLVGHLPMDLNRPIIRQNRADDALFI